MEQETIAMINSGFQVCVIPLLGVLTTYLIKYINYKSNQIAATTDNILIKQYLQLAENAIIDAVKAVNQTFVNVLKDQNIFDEAKQKEAFEKAKTAVIASLSETAKEVLTKAYGDFDAWIDSAIESAVSDNRMTK